MEESMKHRDEFDSKTSKHLIEAKNNLSGKCGEFKTSDSL